MTLDSLSYETRSKAPGHTQLSPCSDTMMPDGPRLLGGGEFLYERRQQIDRHRENNRRVLLGGDFGQRLQEPQLHCRRLLGNFIGRLTEFGRRLKFALGVNDLGEIGRAHV